MGTEGAEGAVKNIVTICGTSRPGNYTGMALAVVEDQLRSRGTEVVPLDAVDMDLAFPGQGDTEDAKALREAVDTATAVVIATPEYHGGFAAMTKLIIENLGFPSVLDGKPVALLGVAGGRIGAIKSLEQLRGVCAHVGGIVLPRGVSVAGVRAAFDKDGVCTDVDVEKSLRGLADHLDEYLRDFVCSKFALEAMVRQGNTPPWSTEL